jgi:hypothetical protein
MTRSRVGTWRRCSGARAYSTTRSSCSSRTATSARQLQCYLRPHSQHLLDWFHLTMQLTGLGQFLKGLARVDAERTADLQVALEHTKWNLWHGKVKRALEWLWQLESRMWHFATRYSKFSALARAVHGFQRYVRRNRHLIPNYAQRRRAGQAISTAFVESLVNSLLSKRFAKKQSMQWTPGGAHLLLQTRTRAWASIAESTWGVDVAPPAHMGD